MFVCMAEWVDSIYIRNKKRSEGLAGGRTLGSQGSDPVAEESSVGSYAELHACSDFSFLRGATSPQDLIEAGVSSGLTHMAITDTAGFYGVVQFAAAARMANIQTIFGAEIPLSPLPVGGSNAGEHLLGNNDHHIVVLGTGAVGYARLAQSLTNAQLCGAKNEPQFSLAALAEDARAAVHVNGNYKSSDNDSFYILTGGVGGYLPSLIESDLFSSYSDIRKLTRDAITKLVDLFGYDRVLVELYDHGDPRDSLRNDIAFACANELEIKCVATNHVHYATRKSRFLADSYHALRHRASLDTTNKVLPATAAAYVRSAAEQYARFARYNDGEPVRLTSAIAQECAFDLKTAAPELPDHDVPKGHNEMSWLRHLTYEGAKIRYSQSHPHHHKALQQIEYELGIIEELNFPGYFLVLVEIVDFCKANDIYCQGRGSSANSAVCYALGVTKADAVSLGLLFERFLSTERDGPPDIDLDIEHERREEVIQYIYNKYGRKRAAQVCNIITYRSKSSVRDAARVAGLSVGQADAYAKQFERHSGTTTENVEAPELVRKVAGAMKHAPRHIGIHSGGMVLADRDLSQYCPIEWARMENRSVLQWDKDDCARAGLVKFDLLGLGMLTMLHKAFDLIHAHFDSEIELATIPQEQEVYDMLCAADTVGVFQIESRAQMSTLPRMKPQNFYDIAVEVAIIRPGPIQGGSVHPYLNRRNGKEPVTYLHPLLEPILKKTLGVPLFQEQLMQIAIDVAGFSPAESDMLRQAMSSKRSVERMDEMRAMLLAGMAKKDITGAVAEAIADKMYAFASFGFPESHAISFAYLVYASSWVKLHYPDIFACALLNSQPMGFYAPHTIVRDAIRHGVKIVPVDINASDDDYTLELRAVHSDELVGKPLEGCFANDSHYCLRVGLRAVKGLSKKTRDEIMTAREDGKFVSLEDLVRRVNISRDEIETLALAGAFESLGVEGTRRGALWAAQRLTLSTPDTLPGIVEGTHAPEVVSKPMNKSEEMIADMQSLGLAQQSHPTEFFRELPQYKNVVRINELGNHKHRDVIEAMGVVTHMQSPGTAKGIVFLTLEDETGLLNVVCHHAMFKAQGKILRDNKVVVIRGILERVDGVTNLVAATITPINANETKVAPKSRDFR